MGNQCNIRGRMTRLFIDLLSPMSEIVEYRQRRRPACRFVHEGLEDIFDRHEGLVVGEHAQWQLTIKAELPPKCFCREVRRKGNRPATTVFPSYSESGGSGVTLGVGDLVGDTPR